MRHNTKTDILKGTIWKQLVLFFIPIFLSTLFQQLYNTVDAIIVGNVVGKEALAAVGGSTGTIINLLIGFFTGLSTGAGVIIAQCYGSRQLDKLHQAVSTSFAVAIAGSALLTVIGIVFAPQLLQLLSVPADVFDLAVVYMRIYFAGTLFNLFYNMGSGVLRAVGDSKRPLYFLVIACVSNIFLDVLFVVVARWGVVGAAAATILSQAISAILIAHSLHNDDEPYSFSLRHMEVDPSLLKQIIMIGLPSGLQSVLYSLSNMLIQSSINVLGTNTVAAYTAYGKLDGFFWGTIGAWGTSMMTFASQNFGAGQIDRLKRSVWVAGGWAIGTTLFIMAVFLGFGPVVYRFFTSDTEVIAIGMTMMKFLVPCFITFVPIEILSSAQRGCGDAMVPTLITALGVVGIRVTWILFYAQHEVISVLTCYPISWIVTSLIFIAYYFQGGWLKKRLQARAEQFKA